MARIMALHHSDGTVDHRVQIGNDAQHRISVVMRARWSRRVSGYQPDILAQGLDVVFCGINPAVSAAADGHNFSHRSNRFWAVLHLAGFTNTRLRPEDERRLLQFGCGITAVATRPTRRASDVTVREFRQARPALEAKIRRYRPRVTAFLGKRAFSSIAGVSDVGWGSQPDGFGGTAAWVLPNPSGLNRNFTLDALVHAYTELRLVLGRPDRCHLANSQASSTRPLASNDSAAQPHPTVRNTESTASSQQGANT
jgi:TDG/mug DNA glycosylase family protein